MEKILFDTHCHLNSSFDENLIEEIKNSPLAYLVDIGTTLEDSREVLKNTSLYDFCYGAVGIWPGNTTGFTEEKFESLKALCSFPKILAIGEIGLDYHYEDTDKPSQKYWFSRFIQLAIEKKLPICIHSRDADEDTLNILKENGAFSKERLLAFPLREDGSFDARVLLHCFSGSLELAREYVKLGADISLGGPLTYKNAKKALLVVENIALCRLMVETDAPYLTPVPFRGRPNKPFYVEYTARKLAEIKKLSYETVAEETFKNAKRFFGIE